jgi:hypothetical protein
VPFWDCGTTCLVQESFVPYCLKFAHVKMIPLGAKNGKEIGKQGLQKKALQEREMNSFLHGPYQVIKGGVFPYHVSRIDPRSLACREF